MARLPRDLPSAVPDPVDVAREERRKRQGRRLVLTLVWVKLTLALLALVVLPAANPYPTSAAGQKAFTELFLFVFGYGLIVLLPAYLLARKGRLAGLCLALLILPDLLAILIIANSQ
jgi:hypothetical protein